MGPLQELLEQIPQCMLADQQRLRRRVERLGAHRDGIPGDALTRLIDEMARSAARRRQRAARLPRPDFPPELPVSAAREEIARAVEANPVTIVCGETGSGKTTQLPKICLALGRGAGGLVGHTQPRRVAARSVAARIAEELGTAVGACVGYQVRFTARVSPETHVKVMTDGILLAEIQTDRYLHAYDTLIIDEAHERSLNIDFLLGYLRRILPRRPDLRIVITSATIDPERFSRHFGDAPVIEVSGRTFPVEVRYQPLADREEDERDRDLQAGIVAAVDSLLREGPGDVLVFLPGEREIRETAEALHKHRLPATEILPLYARLSAAEQDRVFRPHGGRRIVLATNVAETSLTVPNIRFVVDPGLARVSRYSYRTKVARLPIERISRAAADQRKGRCGRVGPGVCVRLYGEEDFAERPAFTEPEIRRTNLAAVILQMRALRLGAVEDFPFIDPPDRRFVSDGYRLLRELGALDSEDRLTAVGKQLARLPVDPRLGRMVLGAADEGCLREVLVIASALSIPDPRERPLDARAAADAAQEPFRDERSDFLGYLRLWDFYHEQARHLSQNKLRKLLRAHFVSWIRMREWREVHAQLAQLAGDLGLRPNREPAEAGAVHRALLTGLLGHVGFKGEDREYTGPRGLRFHLSPGSAVQGAKWVMAAELVETRRLYAHTVARIRPEWIERAAGALVSRSHSEPHWDRRRGEVFAHERVSLWGLTLVPRRRVRFAPVDPQGARAVFIQCALVEGRFDTRAGFLARNLALIAELRELEHKSRRPDILVPETAVYAFYDGRLPAEVNGGASFERWWRAAERAAPECLLLGRDALLREAGGGVAAEDFPEHLTVQGHDFPLHYRFAPGEPDDGVSVCVPLAMLNQLPPEPFEWLVPGLLREKTIALMRTLPKHLRRSFVPLPDFADACLEALAQPRGGLCEALAAALERMTGVAIPPAAWQPQKLAAHLRMRYRVLDAEGGVLAEGRDLHDLKAQLSAHAGAEFAALPTPDFDREGIREWDFGTLPEVVALERHGMRLRGYPSLVEQGDGVALRLLDTPERAVAAHRAGVRRLFLLRCARDARYLARSLPGLDRMCLIYSTLPAAPGGRPGEEARPCDGLKRDLVARIADTAFLADAAPPRDAETFEAMLRAGAPRLVPTGNEIAALVARILELTHEVRQRRAATFAATRAESFADIDSQLAHLVFRGFVSVTPLEWLGEIPRYLQALARRLDKLAREASRDVSRTREIAPLWQRFLARSGEGGGACADPALLHYRWMVEELRVSVFAQELGTRFPVSAPRLERQWSEVGR